MQRTTVKDDLLRPEAYVELLGPEALTLTVTLIETHISWVFLLGEHVFKLKRPVDFGFLDFSTQGARREACLAELRLNRRLAPGVYRDVLAITRAQDGRHRVGGEGEVSDWVVHMNRLPEAARADNLLAAGHLSDIEIDRCARTLVDFHASAAVDRAPTGFGSSSAIAANVAENFEQTKNSMARYLERAQIEELQRFQSTFLAEQASRLSARVLAGRVREGHGDLRLEHVYLLAERVAVIDCIEFSERFRYADVCADVAFLSMDLCEHGRLALAERLLARYALLSDDFELYALVDFYQSYRAHVRAKIATLRAVADDAEPEVREEAERAARHHYLLALSAARRSVERPCVIAVAGLIASGKSSVADRLGARLGVAVVEADRVRKSLSQVSDETPLHDAAFAGHYTQDASEAVYGGLFDRARAVLMSGRSVLLDASFRARAHRSAARALALEFDAAYRVIECRCTRELTLERLHQRARGSSVSDGRIAIFDEFTRRYEPICELGPDEHLLLDTSLPLEQNLERLLTALPCTIPPVAPPNLPR
jgi:aminoglycoside phosphotransferase family enzyme/predicted kinase